MTTGDLNYNWSGKTLLLVEDDNITCFLIGEFLSSTSINFLVADNLADAMELYNNNKIDISVIDIHLQGENGFDIAFEIRKKDPLANILIQTALKEVEVMKACADLGYPNFINKPYTYDAFLLAVDKCLKKQKSFQQFQYCN